MIVTILKNKTHTGKTIIKHIDDFSILNTKKTKSDAPLWNLSNTPNRNQDPLTIGGMIIDYDDYNLPKMKEEYHYYYHLTHNNKYRIIIPFDRDYDYNGKASYQDEYIELLYNLIEDDVEQLFASNIIQKNCCTANRYFFMRPSDTPLIHHRGNEFYKPGFRINSTTELKRELAVIGKPRNYENVPDEAQRILLRMFNFYTYYGEMIDWSHLDTKGVCLFDWHDDAPSGSLFNYPTRNHKATIDCKHATCEEKLREFMHPYQPDGDEGGPRLITCKTVLYIAAAIILGDKTGWSLESVEATGFRKYRQMLNQIDRLKRLRFNAKIDCVNWVKTYHANAVLDPLSKNVYCYEDNVYVQKNEEIIELEYDYTLGTYYCYRLHRKNISSLTYIKNVVKHSMAYMLDNYRNLKLVEHLNLKNGILTFDVERGKTNFRPHSRHIFTCTKVDYEYDPKADCPLWKQTLVDYFEDLGSPQVKLLQEFFGYCLTYDRRLEKLLFLFGESRGGKNTIAQILMALVGGGEISMEWLMIPERRSTVGAHKKMVYVDEVPKLNSQKVISELKKLSSTGGMEMRRMKGDAYTVYDVPKLVIAFNQMPEDFQIDKALKNRMLAIKFTKSFAGKENIHLKDQLLAELPGILNWAIDGFTHIYGTHAFKKYEVNVEELYELANEETFDLYKFLTIKREEKAVWRTTELLEEYRDSCGDYKFSSRKFHHKLRLLNINRKIINGYHHYDLEEMKDVTPISG